MADQTIKVAGAELRVEGLRKTIRDLQQLGVEAGDLKDLMHEVGTTIGRIAAGFAPRKTGTLAGSIRAGRGKTKAVIRAGGARAKYAGVIHYGWPEHSIAPRPFLAQAVQAGRGQALQRLEAGIDKLIRKHS